MDPIRKQQLIRQRTVAKSSLTRMQTLIETDLITFLESRCKALELLQTTQSMKASTTKPCTSRPAGGKISNFVYCNVATQLQCLLCSGSHRLFHCDNFFKLKAKQRYNMPSNHNFVSIDWNIILRTTHVPYTCVVDVTTDIILCYT